ncbi:MAG: cytochrome c family protein, partial [Verrucomicrobia bacterium]|nr:cytochrome c family protein [Verrucomicrobiota bacterium]
MSEADNKPQEKKPAPAKAEGAKPATPKEKKAKAPAGKSSGKDAQQKAEPIIAPESL